MIRLAGCLIVAGFAAVWWVTAALVATTVIGEAARVGLAAAIGEMDGIVLVGEAEFADEVAALVAEATPDVVLLDIRLPDGSGLDVNRWLGAEHPTVRVVMVTMSEDLDGAFGALRDGASGQPVSTCVDAGPVAFRSGSVRRLGPARRSQSVSRR